MNPHNTNQLRALVERWQVVEHWAQRCRIKPRLVTRVFGDGRRLLRLYPIMFRPNHFVVRVDSKLDDGHAHDWLDEIYEAIEEEFYEWPWARQYGLKWHEDDSADCDSRLSWDDGSSWEEMKWPRLKRPKARRKSTRKPNARKRK